jgi:hypothetical protein
VMGIVVSWWRQAAEMLAGRRSGGNTPPWCRDGILARNRHSGKPSDRLRSVSNPLRS